ncbi:MAG: UDP-N-acetylglucosamine 2-epimerase [Pseudomonadota bacterium]|nr:UDP-N-acetylglucosamine 2-epimerase [Pseudomonadota bacterium]
MRKIGLVSVGRSDYGIYLPVLKAIQEDPDLKLLLIVSGMHLAPGFGLTAETITNDGFEITAKVEMLLASDTPEGMAKSIGLGIMSYAQFFVESRPDILVVLGDRFEMYAAVVAALPMRIPVAHIHGGEVTEGAIDDALRHSMTKMSHLHFVSTREYARRVEQMGEEGWRVTVCGAPGLDNLRSMSLFSPEDLEARYKLRFKRPPLLVTFHPTTLEIDEVEYQIDELLAALHISGMPTIFTMPNADAGNAVIRRKIGEYEKEHPNVMVMENLGTQGYFSLMRYSSLMIGNSSSGIIEAPSFALPVVNIGTRQNGRVKATNVIDVGYSRSDILSGIDKGLSPSFREGLRGLNNPYGDGHAAERIVARLKSVKIDKALVMKRFCDLPMA